MQHVEQDETLNLEVLETRLEMESVAALGDGGGTTPVCICHF